MSFDAMSWATKKRTGSPTKKLILLMLADRANKEGFCWPSMKTLVEDCELSRETISRNIKDMARDGLLHVTKHENKGRWKNNVYHLHVTEDHRPCDGGSHDHVTQDHTNQSLESLKEPVVGANAPASEFDKNKDNNQPPSLSKEIDARATACAEKIASSVLSMLPKAKSLSAGKRDKTIERWASDIEKINRIDGYDYPSIEKVVAFAVNDDFWKPNIQSGAKLREKFEMLLVKSNSVKKKDGGGLSCF